MLKYNMVGNKLCMRKRASFCACTIIICYCCNAHAQMPSSTSKIEWCEVLFNSNTVGLYGACAIVQAFAHAPRKNLVGKTLHLRKCLLLHQEQVVRGCCSRIIRIVLIAHAQISQSAHDD
jgi:hypothetical protein